jgi:PAS domain S-box-containing protein
MLLKTVLFILGFVYPFGAILTRLVDFDAGSDFAERFFLGVLCVIMGTSLSTDDIKRKQSLVHFSYVLLFIITYHSLYRAYQSQFSVGYVSLSFMVFLLAAISISNRILLLVYIGLALIGNFLGGILTLKSNTFYQYFASVFLSYIGIFLALNRRLIQKDFLFLSEEDIKTNLFTTSDGFIIADDDLRIQYLNEPAKKLVNVGFEDEYLTGSKIILPVSPLDQKLSSQTKIQLLGDVHIETKYIKAEWMGEPSFLILIKDITTNVKREREERKKTILHTKTLDFAGEGILFMDTEGFVRYANPEALKLMELTEEELVGEFLLDKIHSTTAEGTSVEEENFPMRVTYTEGVPCHVTFDLFWRKDGSFFFAEYRATPVYEGDKLEGAIMIFRDVSKRKSKEDTDKKYADEILHLSNTSTKFLEIYTEAELYRFIAMEVSAMSDGSCVMVNSFDPISNRFQTRSTAGFERLQTEVYGILGRDIKETYYTIDTGESAYIYNTRDEIEPISEGIFGLQYGNWNHKLCIQIEQATKTKKVYCVVLKYRGILLGNIILLHNKDFLETRAMLEIFQNQASINLHRRLLERNLVKEKFRFDPIIQETSALYSEVRMDGTILFVNPALEKVSGYSNEELLGKNWWSIFQKGLQYVEIQDFLDNIKRNPIRGVEYDFFTKKGYKLVVKWDWVYKLDSDTGEELILGLGLGVKV